MGFGSHSDVTRRARRWRRLGHAAAIIVLGLVGPQHSAIAQTKPTRPPTPPPSLLPTDRWDTFSADVTIRRSRVGPDGKSVGISAPQVQYHWERVQTGLGWKTTMTFSAPARPTVQSLRGRVQVESPTAVMRVEDDENGTAPRLYDQSGARIDMPARQLERPDRPAAILPPPVSGQNWIDTVILPAAQRATRQQALERQQGKTVGRVGQFDRFLATTAGETTEILADPQSVVPVEMNVLRDGVLQNHITFTYQVGFRDALVRRGMRSERVASDAATERLVTDVELTNVRLDFRGGQR
jgi:hypothetical protein